MLDVDKLREKDVSNSVRGSTVYDNEHDFVVHQTPLGTHQTENI